MSATEVARNLSDVLNRVAAGERIEVVRNGAPVAEIGRPRGRLVSAERLREVIASAPATDARFADDLRDLRRSVDAPAGAWPS